jgi:hypothetical protein
MNAWGSNSGYAEELAQKGMKKVDNYGEDKVYTVYIYCIHVYISLLYSIKIFTEQLQ